MGPGEEAAGDQRATLQYTLQATWKPKTLTLTIAVTVALAVIVTMSGITIADTVIGAAAGSAAGVSILQSLWEVETKTGEVLVTAAAGGLAGIAAAILRSMVGAQSLTASAVTGAMAGAAIVPIARTQLQWVVNKIQVVIDKLQWVLAFIKRVKAAVKWCLKTLPTATLILGSGSAPIAATASQTGPVVSQVESAASRAESVTSGGVSQVESAASQAELVTSEGVSQAESIASQAESVTSGEVSQAESAASKAESLTSGGAPQVESAASQAESVTSGEVSQVESAASQAESVTSGGVSQAESAASQAESVTSRGVSQAESAASHAESVTSGGVSQAESAASQAESVTSGGVSQAESAASQPESVTSGGLSQAESAASQAESVTSGGVSQVESAASQAESVTSEGVSQAESAASQAESVKSRGVSQAESAASQAELAVSEGISQSEAVALQAELLVSQAESAASRGASPPKSAASKAESAASQGASQPELAESQAKSAVSGGASQAESAALGRASLAVSAATRGGTHAVLEASQGPSLAVSGGASLGVSAAAGGASLGVSAAVGGASLGVSAAAQGASLGVSAAAGGASLGVSAVARGASLGVSAAAGGAELRSSEAAGVASFGVSAALSGATGSSQGLLAGLGFVAGAAKSAMFGSHRHRKLQTEAVEMLLTHTKVLESSKRDKFPQTDRSRTKKTEREQSLLMPESVTTGGLSQESAALRAESSDLGKAAQPETAASVGAVQAASGAAAKSESAATGGAAQSESAASRGTSQSESVASQAETSALGKGAQSASAASGGASQAESSADHAELAVSGGTSQPESVASQAESKASGGTSRPESVASQAESTASGEALQTESAASEVESVASEAESAGPQAESVALHAKSAPSGGTPQAESVASHADLAATQAELSASGGTSQSESVTQQAESSALEGSAQSEPGGASQAESVALQAELSALGGAAQSESAASVGTSQSESVASQAESEALGRAAQSESAASVGTSQSKLVASQAESLELSGAAQSESAESGEASRAEPAATHEELAGSGGTSQTESTASREALQTESAGSEAESLASQAESAASGGSSQAESVASHAESAASAGTSQAESVVSHAESAYSQAESAASQAESADSQAESAASQAESAASHAESAASHAEPEASGGSLQAQSVESHAETAASGGTPQADSVASHAEAALSRGALQKESEASLGVLAGSAGATGLSQGLLAGSGLVAGEKSAIFGLHRHRQLQTEAVEMRDIFLQTERSRTKKTDREQLLLMPDSSENTDACVTGKRIPEQMTEDSTFNDSGEHKETTGVRPDQHLQQEKIGREKIKHLFHKLHLEGKRCNKLITSDVLQITKHSLQFHESCAEEEMVQTFLQKVLMMDYRARYIHVNKTSQQDHTQERQTDLSEDNFDIFKAVSLSDKGTRKPEQIHPMDVQMAVFHCADGFLKQMMVTKLSQCQYALPLLVPDPFTQQTEFPLWTFRQINKSWKMRNIQNEIISQTQPIYKAETPVVFFFRFGSVSSSKSQLMNHLINEKHNTFFHRNCPGSSRTRVLMDGVVEISWFCPSGKNTDKYSECVAFCNLHGDAGDHEKQLHILTEISSVNVVLLPQLDRNDRHAANIQNLYKDRKSLICIFTEDESTVTEMMKGKYKIGLKNRSQSDVSDELRRIINDCVSESSHTFKLEDVSKHSDIRVDEEDDDDCRRGREAAQQMMSLLEKKDLREIKESFLPHQGKLWHQWSQKNRELHRPQAEEKEIDISRKQIEMINIRQQQHSFKISDFINFLTKTMFSHAEHENMFFLKWLRILLDEYTSADLSALHHKYDETWSKSIKLKRKHGKSEERKAEQKDLEKISEELQAVTFGLEHIMREIAQIYESCSFVNENKKDLEIHFSFLPILAAEMMISGSPLELMDGDAAHVPVIWISAVLDQLVQKLGDQRVFVLSVLGLQGSGKSTMLNAMFGLQSAVSAGRCTRGAFMQLIRVSDEMKTQMNTDYILVVEIEGLQAQELSGRLTKDHDNELATFVVGLGNLTLINIFRENLSDTKGILHIVVQAFLRMKKVRPNPSCMFVHQNISDVRTGGRNMEGRRRLQETLDEMTKLAAKDEESDAECFSDIVRFDVQNDVKYFAPLWEENTLIAPPNPNYCENIQELKKSILSHATQSHGMMLAHLKDHIKDLWEDVLNERFFFRFRNALEISAYRKLETEYSKWSWSLRRAMMEYQNKLHNKIENEVLHEVEETDLQRELKKTSEEVSKSMSEFFEKDKDGDILIQWKTSFEIKIKELQESIISEAKSKLLEILQQRDLKKIIDDLRTRHENALYEKSKELALKLKTKAHDEKRLNKKFDLIWKQSVKKIIKDTPAIKEIDIMRDVREILSANYGTPVDHSKVRSNVFSVMSYYDYVKVKRSSGFFSKAKESLGYALSKEDDIQIRSLVTDVVQQTDTMIQSFNIPEMGYNICCIQQLTDYIKKKVTKYEEGSMKCVFKKQFFIDLVYSICKRANEMISDQHRMFRDANDPVIYFDKKIKNYYSIFQKYCHGATSALIFGEIIFQKLKKSIEQSVYKKTARDLTDEIRINCESLNGNRSNLEKHILKTLAEEEDFDKYMNYIHNPRDLFKSFIRDEVSQYIIDKFSLSVFPRMKENIKLLEQKIMRAAHESTERVQEKRGDESTERVQVDRGDAALWLKSFTQQLSDELIFSEKHFSGVKLDYVDFKLLEDVIRQELTALMSEISSRFNTETFPINLDYKSRPDEIVIDHLCQCCWVQCPFCGATCNKTLENHDGDHSVGFHRLTGIAGLFYRGSRNLAVKICTSAVANRNQYFYPDNSDNTLPSTQYRKAGGVYADWSITPDLSDLPYWKWFVCRFKDNLEKIYDKTFVCSEIPDKWRKYSKQEAIQSLNHYI
ncbi:interferon-induced very large GTPase 1-like [Carassius auratus]|uniref:Interferon-induced very large GTPase 1-like n=1 Tax=Carassius auratus TaxID=7957 RepID=A0A6P6QPT7_CARAU|nr:interferon-induced very large GTPase 1-like [Carassius auratus]